MRLTRMKAPEDVSRTDGPGADLAQGRRGSSYVRGRSPTHSIGRDANAGCKPAAPRSERSPFNLVKCFHSAGEESIGGHGKNLAKDDFHRDAPPSSGPRAS